MTAHLGFWSWAFLLMAGMLASAAAGVFRARRGDYRGHRRLMNLAAILLACFLASYGLKLWIAGREHVSTWPAWQLRLLRVHEGFVGLMLVGGVGSRLLSRRLTTWRSRSARRAHRWMGRSTLGMAAAGLVTAACLLAAMCFP